jgi:DnaK suppressor protein
LNHDEVDFYRGLLESVKAELLAGLEDAAGSTAPVSPDNSIGRLTRQEAMQTQQLNLEIRRRNQQRLQQVEAALRRLEQGSYGLCLRCEEPIAEARLRARPEATLCMECAGGGGR